MTRRATVSLLLIALVWCAAAQALAQGAPQQVMPPPGAAPFQLTPQEEADLDALLKAWQQKQVKDFTCSFTRYEYDQALGSPQLNFQITAATGIMRYQAPDKGLFKVESLAKYDPAKGTLEPVKDAYEQWQCDGKSIFMFDYLNKVVKEHPLPPNMQGKEIINGPLPFLFGVDAAKLRQRYWIRVTSTDPNQPCLEAYPRWQQDAMNYFKVDLMLTKDLMPYALQVWDPNKGKSRTVYAFAEYNMLQRILQWPLERPKTPIGWTYQLDEIPTNQPQQPPAQNPGPAQIPGSPLPVR